MRLVARWVVALAFSAAVVFAAARPAWDRPAGQRAEAAAETASSGSGFDSLPAPETAPYISPAPAMAGTTTATAPGHSAPAPAWHAPSRLLEPSARELHVPHRSPHLRSIPLLI